MNREEILAAIKQCQRAVKDGYETYSAEIAQGTPAIAARTLSGVHAAEKELGRLRKMLDALPPRNAVDDALGVPENGVPILYPMMGDYSEDHRPWWKRALGL